MPNWHFFAPNPGIEDYVLVYRLSDSADGPWQPWQRVIAPRKPQVWEAFYSRRSRLDKGVFDIVSTMVHSQGDPALKSVEDACKELLYGIVKLQVLNLKLGTYLQLMVVRGAGYEDDRPPVYDYVFPSVRVLDDTREMIKQDS